MRKKGQKIKVSCEKSLDCHGPAPEAIRNPLLSLAQEENRSGDLSRDFLTDRYRPSVKGNSLKPDLYQVRRLNLLQRRVLVSSFLFSFRSSIELPLALLIIHYTYACYK